MEDDPQPLEYFAEFIGQKIAKIETLGEDVKTESLLITFENGKKLEVCASERLGFLYKK